jgi:hypothetical protein
LKMKYLLTVLIGIIMHPFFVSAKTSKTFYTPDRVAIANKNISKYDWAKAIFDRMKKGDPIKYYFGTEYTSVESFASQTDEFIWLLQPTTKIDRLYPVDSKTQALCPIHGAKGQNYSAWCPWEIDPINHPYKIRCKAGGEWYPSNEYYKGDMTSGQFADDGTGFEYEGKRYYPLVEYAHMVYGTVVIPTLRTFSQAYMLTGNEKYARKGCILIARLASEYPDYDDRIERTYLKGKYHPVHKWKQGGMITDLIWETFCLEATAFAYDGLYDYMDKDPNMIQFLKDKGLPIDNGADLRNFIEKSIFRPGMQAILDGRIEGNEGHHQAAALACALVMDDYSDIHPNSKDMVDFVCHGKGQAVYHLVNGLTRDGGGHESPMYNLIKADFIRVSTFLEEIRKLHPEKFPLDKYPDIFADQKAKRLFDYNINILATDIFLPSIGDSGSIGYPSRMLDSSREYSCMGGTTEREAAKLYSFKRYGDPRYARTCTTFDGAMSVGSLWEYYPEEEIKKALNDPESKIDRKTRMLDGYGVAYLESGEWPNSRAVMFNYTSLVSHRQQDPLTIQLFARGIDFLPDLGYPKTWDYRYNFDSHIMAHNTVTVDETQSTLYNCFRAASLFASVDGVHVVSANFNPYPEWIRLGKKDAKRVDLYERMVVLVDIDEDRFYVVDLFAVNGGEQHDQSWHAMMVTPEVPALDWQIQTGGTLAGENVEQFATWTDRWGRSRNDFPSYMTNIRRTDFNTPQVWQWRSGLSGGDTLAVHVVPIDGQLEAIMGSARSPVRANLEYLMLRRHVVGGGRSNYVTVLDAYGAESVVKSVKLLSNRPIVLEITRKDGNDIVTLNIPNGPSLTTTHRPLGIAVKSETLGKVTRDVKIGSLDVGEGPGYAEATIAGVDYEKNQILLDAESNDIGKFRPGSSIRIYNNLRSAMFKVEKANYCDGYLMLTLDNTALMGRFPVTGITGSKLELGAATPFSINNLNPDELGGSGIIDNYYYGCRVGEGNIPRIIKGILRSGEMCLMNELSNNELKKDYGGKVVSVWHYGVGDNVEVAVIEN